ncbi:N-acetylmuramoyl-L-alanine amidase [Desulfocurvibacter africanus]|uniref:N-acetylmuramoyl-L-alanine amidase n=1 Tax=Desulfocurvibacter africanus subsp. africanus str. Walvis Bay TaxID=690850 RepID=F3Z0S6_DESAF|nr:N-acetylmuramoyl-L-alanine amidase [Desulfocurvibacter africanus]EGJ49900.1 cell wall hydrolase/autolysin [Desulfocurvibacter africanus subsp. africanus str. Walvis Bay]
MRVPEPFAPRLIPAIFLCVLLNLLMAWPGNGQAWAATAATSYKAGWHAFHSLLKNQDKASQRSAWSQVEEHFRRAYAGDPEGSYAPKSLFYLGRVHEELGLRSNRKDDFIRAVDYFQRMSTRFPNHAWTDDSLLRKAKINLERLGEKDLAYVDLLLIVHNHKKGDMHAQAQAMLLDLDRKNAGLPPQAPALQPVMSGPPSARASGVVRPEVKTIGLASLNDIRHRSSSDYTRVVIDVDAEVEFRYQLLQPNASQGLPHRLFIDLQSTKLAGGPARTLSVSDGILSGIRAAQNQPDVARVVLDFQDLQNYHVFTLPDPYRVVVDVYATERKPQALAQAKPVQGAAAGDVPLAVSASPGAVGELIEQLGLTVHTVMIDAGHGGKDPGAVAYGLKEKNIVLSLALKVGQRLKSKGFNVIYTRTTDVFIPLEERTAMANVQKADMFVSIHVNANRKTEIHGLETYSLNLARTQDAVRVAARENAVSEKRISDLQVILTDLMLNSKVRESTDLAKFVQSATIASVKRSYNLKDHGTREAPFYVLMGAKMPSILVEAGYLTNKNEANRLRNPRYQDMLADGIVQGVLEYKKKIERYASL